MDLGRGGDVVRVRHRPRYVAAQRGTSATPWRLGYVKSSLLKAGAGSYGQLALSWLSDVPFLFLYVNVNTYTVKKPPSC
jgi:hypothetical protein